MNTSSQQDNSELDRLRLEEQKRKLIEEVRDTVEKGLFRTYRNTFAIVVATLGVVGVTVGWPALRSVIDAEVERQIALRAEKPVKEAEQLALTASRTMYQTSERLNIERDNIIKQLSGLVEQIEGLNKQSSDATTNLKKAQTGLSELQANSDEARKLIDFLKTTVQVKPVSQDDLKRIEGRVAELAAQASKLGDAVKLVSAPGANRDRVSTIEASLTTIAQAEVSAPQADVKAAAVVYVQFAGGSRATIERLMNELETRKWRIPTEERLASAAGKHEVRYYHDEDAKAAELFSAEANAVAEELGIAISPIEPRKFAIAKKPNRGIIELWLQVP